MSNNVEKKLYSFKEIEIDPSLQLVNKTKLMAKVASEQRKKKSKVNWLPTILTASLAAIAILFAVFTFINLNSPPSMISSETAAIYSLDINPSIEFGVDSKREVIEVKSLNEDGKILLKEVNCIGLLVDDCINQLIKKAVELGYIDEDEANYVIVSEILVKEDYESMKIEINDLEKPESVKFVFLIGDIENKESADIKGISTGKEIFQEKAKEIGIEITDSDLAIMSITEVVNATTQNVTQIFEDVKEYEKPIISTKLFEGAITINWNKITDDELTGYKVVVSKNNQTPKYPDDGYLVYITDVNQTSYTIDNLVKYIDGDFGGYLIDQENYYISITAVYKNNVEAGNAVLTKYASKKKVATPSEKPVVTLTPIPVASKTPAPIVYSASQIEGNRLSDGSILLTWDKIESEHFVGYKVVASKTNASPSYPNDGYIKYITDKNTTALNVGNEFSSKLSKGDEYYFSITTLFDNVKIPGNAVKFKYMEKEVTPPIPVYNSSIITGERLSDGSIILGWSKIDSSNFAGYKVVASVSNANPSYPDDGYITYITDKNISSLAVDLSYASKLTPGVEYYFSITVLYNDYKVAGNAIKLKYLDESTVTSQRSSTISGQRLPDGSILLNWEQIDDTGFSGYKIVASASNENPVYPADGYIKYITNRNTTSLLIDSSYASKLTPGRSYYFSITTLYGDHKIAGNSTYIKYLEENATSSQLSSSISGQRLPDGSILLNWEQIDDTGFSGYKIVASASNENPVYPADGYIKYITDKNTTSLLVDSSYVSKLTAGTSYYFSITTLYGDQKVAGNSTYIKYLEENVTSSKLSSSISGQRLPDGSVLLNWEQIDDTGFSGYKVVASANNPNPSYPADGYIKYITDKNTTSLLVDSSYTAKLTPGISYYFSITVLYGDQKVVGNSVYMQYYEEGSSSEQVASTITGERLLDGSIVLNWEQIDEFGFSGYKVVASASNENPVYPADGYIKYITDKTTTTLVVDSSYTSKLTSGTSYYFSITVLYGEQKVAGNAIYLQYSEVEAIGTYPSTTITGQRLTDGSVLLTWDMIDETGFEGYKVVASATNPNPTYATDGYISWITDKNTTSLLVDSSFTSKLTEGVSYYFSITVLYQSHSIQSTGNTVYLVFK